MKLRALLVLGALALAFQTDENLKREFIDARSGFSHAVSIEAGNVKTIYTSGQVGDGDDLLSQTRSAFENLQRRLEAAGASLDDIVKLNIFIVNYNASDLDSFREVRFDMLGDHDRMPAHTLVGVETLAVAGDLIEIEAVAVVAK